MAISPFSKRLGPRFSFVYSSIVDSRNASRKNGGNASTLIDKTEHGCGPSGAVSLSMVFWTRYLPAHGSSADPVATSGLRVVIQSRPAKGVFMSQMNAGKQGGKSRGNAAFEITTWEFGSPYLRSSPSTVAVSDMYVDGNRGVYVPVEVHLVCGW